MLPMVFVMRPLVTIGLFFIINALIYTIYARIEFKNLATGT